jgi:catechol 2,3-dioxygenase-like lactoylglutathione lyase family enzyme
MGLEWRHMNPVFEVADIDRSLEFYRDVLGLTPHWRWQSSAAGLYTESLELYLARVDAALGNLIDVDHEAHGPRRARSTRI